MHGKKHLRVGEMGKAKPRVLVVTGEGFNAETELKNAWSVARASPKIIHINTVLKKPVLLKKFKALCFPGGFTFGDNLGAGKALASKIFFSGKKKSLFLEELISMIEKQKIVLGICNGFQVLACLGLFPGKKQEYGVRNVSLATNNSLKFEDRWVNLRASSKKTPFLKNISFFRCPVRHAQGKIVFSSKKEFLNAVKEKRIALQYCDLNKKPTERYPFNPNGSIQGIAGITDKTGLVLGLMPHPEAAIFKIQDTTKKREFNSKRVLEKNVFAETKKFFENGVNYLNEL